MVGSLCGTNEPRISISPSVWGPPTWRFLYAVALAYPNSPTIDEMNAARNMLMSLAHLLPCAACRVNYNTKLGQWAREDIEDAVKCSEAFVAFVHKLESAVALGNNKSAPSFADSVQRAIRVETGSVHTGIDGKWLITLIPAAILGSLVTYLVMRKKINSIN